ncbi:hypothetical protein GY45DRAFT_1367698 [Cubamyces sp. BRFM 1775]|nr:hypothetical protein GY45DRAFT_1367698 [Cubamyces sp. BRFM 1775]
MDLIPVARRTRPLQASQLNSLLILASVSRVACVAAMDAFFTIASPVPAEEPVEDILVDTDAIGTNGNHGSCVIA